MVQLSEKVDAIHNNSKSCILWRYLIDNKSNIFIYEVAWLKVFQSIIYLSDIVFEATKKIQYNSQKDSRDKRYN